jgi:hypothetical protein
MTRVKPAYIRQAVLLTMIEMFGDDLTKIDIQKLLFIYTQRFAPRKHYDFIPYMYGCYSLLVAKDIKTMINYGFIRTTDEKHISKHPERTEMFRDFLSGDELDSLYSFYNEFNKIRGTQLIRYVYENYPYYAQKSLIASEYISNETIEAVILKESEAALFTIGYEGRSFEEYINQLIQNNISVLYDVRKNPYSMKFGFSKHTMKQTLETIGICYIHIPELGVDSKDRVDLRSICDYDKLFDRYEQNTLPKAQRYIDSIAATIDKKGRAAMTCFERSVRMCHRGRIAQRLEDSRKILSTHL